MGKDECGEEGNVSESTPTENNTQTGWPGGITAITLFVEDLVTAKRFYREVFELPVVYEDDNSTVFRFGETLVNLLKTGEAPSLVARRRAWPLQMASGSSSRSAWTTSTRWS